MSMCYTKILKDYSSYLVHCFGLYDPKVIIKQMEYVIKELDESLSCCTIVKGMDWPNGLYTCYGVIVKPLEVVIASQEDFGKSDNHSSEVDAIRIENELSENSIKDIFENVVKSTQPNTEEIPQHNEVVCSKYKVVGLFYSSNEKCEGKIPCELLKHIANNWKLSIYKWNSKEGAMDPSR